MKTNLITRVFSYLLAIFYLLDVVVLFREIPSSCDKKLACKLIKRYKDKKKCPKRVQLLGH